MFEEEEEEEEDSSLASALRTVATYDDALHHQKIEDSSSPKSILELEAMKRNHSDSNLVQLAGTKALPWKCNLCFYKNANNSKATCAMCGTHKDDSFMEALNAMDHLGEGVKQDDKQAQAALLQDKEASFRGMSDQDSSFETAEDNTQATFQTAQQSQSATASAEARTIHPPPAAAAAEEEASDNDKQNESFLEYFRDTTMQVSRTLVDVSVDSSITCNSLLNQSQALTNMDDSIHTLLNTTQTNDEDFDPMLFNSTHSEDMAEDGIEQQLHDYETPTKTSIVVPLGDAGHEFSFDQEFHLAHIIGNQGESQPQGKTTIDGNKNKLLIQTQDDVESQNDIVFEKEESLVSRKVWLVRGGIVSFVFLVVLVSVLSIV